MFLTNNRMAGASANIVQNKGKERKTARRQVLLNQELDSRGK